MRTIRALLFVLLTVSSAAGCPPDETAKPRVLAQKLSRSKALHLARIAAQKDGFDLSKYVLDTFGGSGKVTPDGTEWLFAFVCYPPETRFPGCEILVAVNRSTGKTNVMPGE